ncbi:MAG: DUF624 domain-containing protein [Clostridium sp.]|nr:DUF624 domain-containing protein [Clostridium sp.]
MKLFSTEGALYKFMMQFVDLLVLNFMWILCSIPLITIGASTAAAAAVTMKMAKDEESYIAKQFLKEFKRNWKQGTILWGMILLSAYALYLDVQILKASENPSLLVICMTMGLIFLMVICFTYSFALIARYENSIPNTIRNSMKIVMQYFGRTLVLLFSIALIIVVLNFTEVMIFFMIIIGPGCIFYTYGYFCRQLFERIEKEQSL